MASVRQQVPNTKVRLKVCVQHLDEFKWILPLSHLMTNHALCSSPGSLDHLQKPSWDHPQNSEMVLCCLPQGWCW